MEFVIDPPIATKIREMHKRSCWQAPALLEREIDRTQFLLDDGRDRETEFSFLVIGDSGSGEYGGYDPQYVVAEQMHLQREGARFILHTGDVVYAVGSQEFYYPNFIKPYRYFLQAAEEHPETIASDRLVFNLPFLPVLGNHDYYDLPLTYSILMGATQALRRFFPVGLDLAVGWHGSNCGEAYARAFLDCLDRLPDAAALARHLEDHYTASAPLAGPAAKCLRYVPGAFTCLPNRYYTFRAGGIDFFALDSNTFNAPAPLPTAGAGQDRRDLLQQRLGDLERERQKLLQSAEQLRSRTTGETAAKAEHLDELRGELERLDEIRRDIQKQLAPDRTDIDWEQLRWLEAYLIASCQDNGARGRILFFHHPPYVTEASKWYQEQTRVVRHRLRWVLDKVAAAIGWQPGDRPIVDIVFNGHAHCLEHLQTLDTGHGDAHTNWIICGGSGYSLRRQRSEGPDLEERHGENTTTVARSRLFIGKNGHGSQKRRPYTFLRVDVGAGTPPQYSISPFVSERYQQKWQHYAVEPFTL